MFRRDKFIETEDTWRLLGAGREGNGKKLLNGYRVLP